ncbi:MAG: hypothetical protein AAF597_08000, partial [Bacteroidota bacterium]
ARTQVQGFDNRAMQPPPELRLDYLDPFPRQAEPWFNDNFPWRGLFQRFNGQLRAWTGARSPLPDKVVFGSDDWLYKGGLQLDLYRGKRRFTPAELRQVVAELTARRDSIAARGGQYYLAIPPLKHHIYPQFLPDYVRPLNQEYAAQQLYNALRETDLNFINLHQPLLNYAQAYPPIPLDTANLQTTDLYYRTDHHWTVRAGYLAATTILERLRTDGIPVELPNLENYSFTSQPGKGLTLAEIAGIDRQNQDQFITLHANWTTRRITRNDLVSPPGFPYPNIYVKHYRQKSGVLLQKLPSLFVTRESFGENIVYPLREQFGKSFFLFDEWQHNLNLEEYDREGGDVYLQLIWEGFLFNLLEVPEDDGRW